MKLHFISPMFMTAKIENYAVEGSTIKIGGLTYQELRRKPRGRKKVRTLTQVEPREADIEAYELEAGQKLTFVLYR